MSYVKADNILPEELIKQIQKYIDGTHIYIPRRKSKRKQWGECTGTKKALSIRNENIFKDYVHGKTVRQLSEKYYLVEESIRRILRNEKHKET